MNVPLAARKCITDILSVFYILSGKVSKTEQDWSIWRNALRENCPYSRFFWFVFSPNARKIRTIKTPNADNFYALLHCFLFYALHTAMSKGALHTSLNCTFAQTCVHLRVHTRPRTHTHARTHARTHAHTQTFLRLCVFHFRSRYYNENSRSFFVSFCWIFSWATTEASFPVAQNMYV